MSRLPPTAAGYFGGMVESYDSLIRRAVPRYDEMTDVLLDYLPPAPRDVIELGCGTGNLALRLLQKFPGATVIAVDAAPEMTALTAQRAAGAGHRLRTVTARFEAFEAQDGSADLVVSSMSLHHVRDKGALYRGVARWLRPGGTLAFADQLAGATGAIQAEHWRRWLAFCRQPGHCTAEEIASLEEHAAQHDHYVPLHEHLALMSEAGFVDADCVWRHAMYSVLVARRGGTRP